VLSILDQAILDLGAIDKEDDLDVLRAVLLTIERHVDATTDDVPGLRSRLPQLLSLYSAQPSWTLLERLIARAVDSACTAWIDGIPTGANDAPTLESLVVASCSRWAKRVESKGEDLDISVSLKRPEWTQHTVSIIKSLIYASEISRQVARTFLESRASTKLPALHLAPVIWSWLDASDISDIRSSGTWRNHFRKLTASIIDTQFPQNHRLTCRRAILAMVQKFPSLRDEFFSDLLACINGMSPDTLTPEMLQLGKHLIEVVPGESDAFASSLLEHALGWISRFFAGPDPLDTGIVKALGAKLLLLCDFF
jgi:hypothetical protein